MLEDLSDILNQFTENNSIGLVLFLDLSKAFDTVDKKAAGRSLSQILPHPPRMYSSAKIKRSGRNYYLKKSVQ